MQQVDAGVAIKRTGIRKQLEDDGIWICEETATTADLIERTVAALERKHPIVVAEWSIRFWQEFFFKRGNDSRLQLLQKCLERRQLHSESFRNVRGAVANDPDDRLPPIVESSRHSVAVSAEP